MWSCISCKKNHTGHWIDVLGERGCYWSCPISNETIPCDHSPHDIKTFPFVLVPLIKDSKWFSVASFSEWIALFREFQRAPVFCIFIGKHVEYKIPLDELYTDFASNRLDSDPWKENAMKKVELTLSPFDLAAGVVSDLDNLATFIALYSELNDDGVFEPFTIVPRIDLERFFLE